MTRILYWNIGNFSLKRINDPSDPATSFSSQLRYRHIIDEVFMPHTPDILVIVEVFSRNSATMLEGCTVGGNAALGVWDVLVEIQEQTGNDNWSLIPPIWSGTQGFTEAVAVYYDSTHLQFLGPYVWGPDYRTASRSFPLNRACPLGQTVRPIGYGPAWPNGPGNYDPFWTGAFAQHRAFPGGGGMPTENRLAAQWEFYGANGVRIHFSEPHHRSPCYCKFRDLTVPGGRAIKLFAVHTSPGSAINATRNLADIQELQPALNEVSVVVGDFNVDGFVSGMHAYTPLLSPPLSFTMGLDPRNPLTAAPDPARQPYCQTHLLPVGEATPFGMAGLMTGTPTANIYPRFGYTGAVSRDGYTLTHKGCLDNIFTKYGGGTAPGPAANMTVVNTIVGSPYNVAPIPPAVGTLAAGLAYPSRLMTPIPLPMGRNSTAVGADWEKSLFQIDVNFGTVRETSDHLPLIIEV